MAYLKPYSGMAREGRSFTGAVVTGTDEVQTLTIGGTPTGGSFRLAFKGQITSAIAWTATDATLVASIDTALGALSTIGGASNVTTAAGTLSSGIGTVTITFVAALAKKAVPLITVFSNDLTGTAPTLAIAETTPGVTATFKGTAKGTTAIRTDTGVIYVNTGTPAAPTATAVGAQS